MSLLLVNQLLAVLGTDSVAVVRRTRGLRRRIVDQKQVHFPRHIEDESTEVSIWQPAIHQLDMLINAMKVKSKSQLNITLASEFVRYLSLPPQQFYMNAVEKIAYATAAYREIYGSVVDEWEIRLQDAPMHETAIVAAIDKRLLEALNQVAVKYQLKLITVKPYLMSAFNSLTKQVGRSSGYLVIVEFKRLLLVNLQQGKCVNVRMFNLGSDWQAELKNLMVRESVLSESKNREILVYAPVQKNIVINSLDGWQLKRISTLNKLSNYHFAMLEVAL
ncbi:hypothetical protein [Methylotenera sp.]|uniref:hypothetical protein n=1 Tax=Methylotenera sp. TaxID=2051956 RepID=UPI002487AC7F|nr:hypothetical protein [Methylotenera sp.]MDI1298989.1 hypothetical protein [Methylotenera sp.]